MGLTARFTGLWLHHEFRKLWGGQAASLFASQLMFLALPLTAVSVLDATPFQMGVVTAMAGLPALIGLYMGSWVDRRKRLPVIVAADVGRALLLAVIPVAHIFDVLTIEIIYAVSFGVGAMSILFQIAYRSFLPSVVKQEELVEANSKLEFATSGTGAVGPAIGGGLVQLLTAPFTLFFGAGLYTLSALLFRRIRVDERQLDNEDPDSGGGVKEGWRFFRNNRILVGLGLTQFTAIMFGSAFEAIFILYMVDVLGLNAGTIGLMFAVSSAGLFIGAWLSSRYTSRIGIGRATTIGIALVALGDLSVPLADGPSAVVVVIIVLGGILTNAAFVAYNIGQVSIRQAITPDRLQGRITSIMVVMSRASVPVGGILGGLLGELLGLRTTLLITGIGAASAALWMVLFQVWPVRTDDSETEAI